MKHRERGKKGELERVCAGEWQTRREWEEEGRGMLMQRREGLSSPCFLLGSLQDSPSGEKPALKRRLFRTSPASRMFARVCVRTRASVCFYKKRKGWWTRLDTDWSQNDYHSREVVHRQLFAAHTHTHTHIHTHWLHSDTSDSSGWSSPACGLPHPTLDQHTDQRLDVTGQATICVTAQQFVHSSRAVELKKKPTTLCHSFHPCLPLQQWSVTN